MPYYALPCSVRWAPDIMQAYQLIVSADEDMRNADPDFSAYQSLRVRDFLSDDYEDGDQAASILRVLQKNQPRTLELPYQTMQLRQMHYFLERDLLSFDLATAQPEIDYDRYNEGIGQIHRRYADYSTSG